MKTRRSGRTGRAIALGLVSLALWACSPKPFEIRVTPAKVTLYGPGHTQSLKYDVCDKKGNPLPGMAVVWTSDKPKVATIDANGLVRSLAPGRATMTATFQKLTSSVAVEVHDVASLTVSPSRVTLVGSAGAKMALLAEIKDGKGNPSLLKPKWLSGDLKVATVDADGVVTSVAEGRTTILASLGNDVTSACDIKVLNREIAAFELTPVRLILKVGEVQKITATIQDVTGVLIEDAALAWTTSDPRTATVSNGAVTGVARGTAKISVATASRTLSADVLVN
ncbi:MAG TPA: Ig-like domain-containing protein [Thermoanaerobaculia bacterium]|nr:Ig-like domain-containing protein [Thermoanaerobaculia bacterium]